MLIKKARRVLAGLCVALMLTQSVGESALTVVAADRNAETAATEGLFEGDSAADASLLEEDIDVDASLIERDIAADESHSGGDEQGTVTGEDNGSSAADKQSESDEASQGAGDKKLNDRVLIKKDGSIIVDYDEDGYILFGKIDSNGVVTVSNSILNTVTSLFKNWEDVTAVQFEEGARIKFIGNTCFMGCKNLKKVDFSNCQSLTQINSQAFSGCTSLEEVKFNDNLQFIYGRAFENCALKGVTLVPGLSYVYEYAFSGCKSLESVTLETANVKCNTATGNAAEGIFNGCNIKTVKFALRNLSGDNSEDSIIVPANLFNKATFAEDAEIVIPREIQEIGEGAFAASNLREITFENTEAKPSSLSTIGKKAFYQCKSLGSITFPSTVQTLGESSFEECTGLTELVIPDSITTFNNRVFYNCNNVTTVQLPNSTTTVGDYVFAKCSSLPKVVLPEGLTFTGRGEFLDCKALSSVTIPSTMEIIGDETFKNTALVNVKLPDSVTSLGKGAFETCSSLTTIHYSDSLTLIDNRAFYKCLNLTSNVFPETLTTIGDSAFEDCQSFYNLTIPANVTKIGNRAFWGCYGISILTINSDKLTTCGTAIFALCLLSKVHFPDGITTIPANLFSQARFTTDCKMTIPNTVTTIGDNAFGGTNAIPVNVSVIQFEEGTKLTKIGNNAFTYCTALGNFTIPETTEEIGQNAFAGCSKISSIVIPENVTKIGAGAFSGCSILSDITYNAIKVTTSNLNIFAKCNIKRIIIGEKVAAFPANLFKGAQFSTNTTTGEVELISVYIPASVETIGEYALPSIANLQKIVFAEGSKLTTIGQYAFWQCLNLTDCDLPDSVTSIGNFAFAGCTNLGSDSAVPFTIPESLVTLGSSAFQDCPSLTKVVIPTGVTKIGDKAFMNDTGLTTVMLAGGGLTEIGVSAFEGCTALTEISIPNGVTKIGATAFKNCSALTKVVIPFSVTSIGKDAFAGCGNAEFFVVPGSYAEKWLGEEGLASSKLLTITYVLNDGTNAPENPAGYDVGDTFLFAPATRKGYAFKGWYLDEKFNTEIKGVEGCTGNITIYAKWEIERYHIEYILDGGVNDKENPEYYTILDKITLKDATKENYTFEGWYTDLSNTRSRVTTINAGNSGDKILYAKWSVNGMTKAPVASIESGSTVKAGTKLFLTCETPGARIFYTLDETEPTETSTQYVDGIVIDKDLTVKAIAVRVGLVSEVSVFVYRIVDEASDWGDILPEDRTQCDNNAAEVPNGLWVAGVEDVDYTGKKITFDLRVYDNKTLLQEKTDYTVKYANNTNAGEKTAPKKAPSVTITAKGNYKGKDVVKFTISPKNISGEGFSAEDMAGNVTGKLQKPVPVLYYGKTKLKNKKDYSIKYVKVAENGSETEVSGCDTQGEYMVKLKGEGNFTGERTVKFTLANGISVAKAKITGLTSYPYTGEEITPEAFTVKVGSSTLNKTTDYDISYSNNVDAGTATVTIKGKGSYCGMKKATFKITPIAAMNKVNITLDKTSVTYTGTAYEVGNGINVTAEFSGKTLTKDADYTCEYKKNTDAGTATIIFTGKGGYSGTAKKTFKIVSEDISDASKFTPYFLDSEGNVNVDKTYAFTQGGVKPSIQLIFGGTTLVAGKDYTLSYKDNTTNGSKAGITVKGKKNFKGTINLTFTIVPQDAGKLSLSVTDVIYKNAPGVLAGSKPTVTDENGKALVEGTDYQVSYAYENNTKLEDGTDKKKGEPVRMDKDIIPKETQIAVNFSFKGNYTGKAKTIIRVCNKSIASAKVKVNPQTYTGSKVEPGIDQMTVMLGNKELHAGDFMIVDYTNNVKKGTAKVTIRGVGEYGGTKTVNFKIVQKPFVLKIFGK